LANDVLTSPDPSGFAEYLRFSKEGEIRRLIYGMSECQELNDLVNRRIEEIYSKRFLNDERKKEWYEAIDKFRFLERSVKYGSTLNSEENEQHESVPQAQDTNEKTIAEYLKSEGYIAKEPSANGKYDLCDNAKRTIHRFLYNNYQEHEDWNFLIDFLDKHTNHCCTIESLKRSVREAKKIVPGELESEKMMENIKDLSKIN
jgi:hypothetical protein